MYFWSASHSVGMLRGQETGTDWRVDVIKADAGPGHPHGVVEARVDNQPNTPQPAMQYAATSVVTCPPKRGTLTVILLLAMASRGV